MGNQNGDNGIDYASFPVPDPPPTADHPNREGKPYEEYSYAERRAWLYRAIDDAGHPRNLERSQRQLATRFGVSQPTISKDIRRIREYEAGRAGATSTGDTEFVLRKAVRELLAEGKWKEAAHVQMEYEDWLMDTGQKDREPDRLEAELTTSDAYLASLKAAQEAEGEAVDG